MAAGVDYDNLPVGDWFDIAWSRVVEAAPLMADPARYRKVMYDLFFEGRQPELTAEEKQRLAKQPRRRGGGAPSRQELDALEALRLKASQLRRDPRSNIPAVSDLG